MNTTVRKGSWVEIKAVVLLAGRRADQVPADTARCDLVMKVKGTLNADAVVGSPCTITTRTGRTLSGVLEDAHPGYHHTYGPPPAELLAVGDELRRTITSTGGRHESSHLS